MATEHKPDCICYNCELERANQPWKQETNPTPQIVAPPSVGSGEWVDALAENIERRMRELYKGRCLDHDEVIIQRAVIVALSILLESLRADTESASTGRDQVPATSDET